MIKSWEEYIKINEGTGEKETFKVGDRVIVSDKYIGGPLNRPIRNMDLEGTIKSIENENLAHIEFDSYMGGHDDEGKGKRGHCWNIRFQYLIKIEDKETRIRWYNKGKLDESYSSDDFQVGDIVVVNGIFDDREFNEVKCRIDIINGDHILIMPIEDEWQIIEGNWWVPSKMIIKTEPVNKTLKIRWYNKGKLNEKKLFESRDEIGKRVKMKENCKYWTQAYGMNRSDSGIGTIYNYIEGDRFPYQIKWDNGYNNFYGRQYFDFLEDLEKDKTVSIKWHERYIISLPSGEVIYVTEAEVKELGKKRLVLYDNFHGKKSTKEWVCQDYNIGKVKSLLSEYRKTSKKEIVNFLKECGLLEDQIKIYEDLSVDVMAKVNMSHMGLTKIPFKFKLCASDFICSNNKLTTLENAPFTVHGNFNCSFNLLENLVGGPRLVSKMYNCSNNALVSLKGAPVKVNNFNCSTNFLSDWKDGPEVKGVLIKNDNLFV
jgi:hypothetical protein